MANITKRTNKAGEVISYRIRVAAGYDVNGQKRKPYERTWKPSPGMTPRQIQKELDRITIEFENECLRGLASVKGGTRIVDFAEEYLQTQQSVLAPRTYEQYERFVHQEIVPQLGHMKLDSIRPAHVQQFVEYLQTPKTKADGTLSTPSPATLRRKLAILQSMLRLAVKLGLLHENPADAKRLTLPKTVQTETAIFSETEAQHMLQCLKDEPLQYQVLVWLAIVTGCRCGELCALQFSDFDLESQRVSITKSAYKVKGEEIAIKPPKDHAHRTIAVDRFVCELVRQLEDDKQRQQRTLGSAWNEGGWLFTQWDGKPMHPQTPTRWWKKFLARHEIPHRKFHALRHTSATFLLHGNVDIRAVQERLGHSSVSVTNKYLHVLSEVDRQAASVLDQMLRPNEITVTQIGQKKEG